MRRNRFKELYWDNFASQITRRNGRFVLYPISVLDISKTSSVELNDILELGFGHFKGSKAETYLKLQDKSRLLVNGYVKLSYGSTIQLFKESELILGRCFINSDSLIACCKRIVIGNHVTIARGVKIYDGDHHLLVDKSGNVLNKPKEIIIGDNVWIGVNAVILKGVTIGEGSVIAAGAIVTKDVPPHSMVAGNPARVIRENVEWK